MPPPVSSVGQIQRHEGWVNSVAFSPDGKLIVSGSADATVRLWDAATGKHVGDPLTGHQRGVNSVAFSPDGQRIVSGGSDGSIRLWETATGKPLGEPFLVQGNVDSVAFSPDGRQIVSGGEDGWCDSGLRLPQILPLGGIPCAPSSPPT